MKVLYLAISAVSFTLLIFTQNAFASVDLNAYMAINGHPVAPVFKFSKTIYIDYPSGSVLQKELNGKNVTIEFTDDSDHNPSIGSFVQQLNTDITDERRSSSKVTNLTMHYEAIIHGNDKQASIDYIVTLKPTLDSYVINSEIDKTTVLDASWIGFSIKAPVVITTESIGALDINSLLGIIENQLPVVYDELNGTPAENALNTSLLDANPLVAYPIDSWNTLYDPSYTLDDVAGSGYVGQKIAVTGFAYGQHDLMQSTLQPKSTTIDFATDSKYRLTIIDKTSTGTIDVEGHANGYFVQGMPAISTTAFVSTCCASPIHWYDDVPWWMWVSICVSAIISFWIFYFRRFKE